MPTPGMYLPKCMVRMKEGVGELDFAVAYHFSASYGDFYDHASHKVLRLFGLKVISTNKQWNRVSKYEDEGESAMPTQMVL